MRFCVVFLFIIISGCKGSVPASTRRLFLLFMEAKEPLKDGDGTSDESDEEYQGDDGGDDGSPSASGDDDGHDEATAGKKRYRDAEEEGSSEDVDGDAESDSSLASDAFDTIDKTNIVAVPEGQRATRASVRAAAAAAAPRSPPRKPRADGDEDGEAELSD